MHIVTSAQMRELDRRAIEEIGIPSMALMENAGKAIAEEVIRLCRERQPARADRNEAEGIGRQAGGRGCIRGDAGLALDQPEREHWLILAGKGNNGGDGLVAARHLREAGIRVTVVYALPPEQLQGDAALQRDAAAALGIPLLVHGRDAVDYDGCTGIVDALLGTGAHGQPRGAYADIIAAANASGKTIVSADIPSGWTRHGGSRPAVHRGPADRLPRVPEARLDAVPRRGSRRGGGGALHRDPLGAVRSAGRGRLPADRSGAARPLARRHGAPPLAGRPQRHVRPRACGGRKPAHERRGAAVQPGGFARGQRPRDLGAACTAAAAYGRGRAGNYARPRRGRGLGRGFGRNGASAGRKPQRAGHRPGLGRFEGDGRWLRRIWEQSERPLVVDADALNMLADCKDLPVWQGRKADAVLTPHPGEMARLTGLSVKEVQRDRIGSASLYAATHRVTLVLKGARTVIAGPDGTVYVNTTGNAGMATAGSGDVLTGIIAGLLAQGLDGVQAAAYGVYLHGLAGDAAAERRGHPSSLIAGDLIEAL
ncbi:Bifunctional NAD(P)H-hydrate repair enzyme Nnr [Paenibacillus sp. P1XP2]|nr:Bifunctional NAD(P)H-hydrate repair enzyme Nnr [Paenibacillus sp. P1XP2]